MSDLIGTVRRQTHEDGFTVWAKVATEKVDQIRRETYVAAEWLCVYSTVRGNCGQRLPRGFVEHPCNLVIGTIPGTPAANQVVT